MTTNPLGTLIMDLVPHWLTCEPHQANASLSLGSTEWPFFEMRAPSDELVQFKLAISQDSARWVQWLSNGNVPSVPSVIQETLAISWLRVLAPNVNWSKILTYATSLSSRTYENSAIVTNLVISPLAGTVDISDPLLMKLTATLGSSMQSYLRVDGQLRLIGFESIAWNDIHNRCDYKLYPEFLHPVNSVLELDEVSVNLTGRGDLLIMTVDGLRAARRKGQWRIYEPATLRDVVADMITSYQVASNLFELLLDLSFKRHGALLIYDPDRAMLDHVVNQKSMIYANIASPDPLHAMLGQAVAGASLGSSNGLIASKRILAELASLDGAVIFDETQILAVGAMIATHTEAGNHDGARTTAAMSALAYGAYPIKVSSDGDIELYFSEDNPWSIEPGRSLSFL